MLASSFFQITIALDSLAHEWAQSPPENWFKDEGEYPLSAEVMQ